MALASYAIQKNVSSFSDPQAAFICTNMDIDTISPIDPKLRFPGNGTFVAALEKCSGRKATVVGKPNPFCIDLVLENHNITRDKILFIGDNLQTDIMFSNKSNISSLLVLTGVTDPVDLEKELKEEESGVPTYIARDLRLDN